MAAALLTRRVFVVALSCGVALVSPPLFGQGGAAPPPAAQVPAETEAALVARARGIHDRVITADTHNDISPNQFTPECNYTMRLTTQVNLPKMKEGGLDVSFMIAYTGQGALTAEGYQSAYNTAVAKFDAVHRLTEQIAPKEIGLALTADDVRKIAASGRKVAVIGIENGYPIGEDLERVKEFYNRGGRYMSLAHNGHSQLADSNTGEANDQWMWGGLSPLGKKVIAEMNRWGIMVDVSHPSKGSMMQAVGLSKAPVIASHSAIRSLANHSRNLDDEQLFAIKNNGGVVQVVAFAAYVKVDPNANARAMAMAQLREQMGIVQPQGGRGGGAGGGAGGGGGGNRGGAAAGGAATGAAATTAAAGGAATGRAGAAGGATAATGAGGGRAAGGAAAAGGGQAAAGGAAAGGGRGGGGCAIEDPNAPARGGRGGGGGGGGRGGGGGGGNAALDALTPAQRAEYDRRLARINAQYPPMGARANVQDFVNHIDYAVKLIGIDHVGISSDFDGGGGIDGWNGANETFNVTLELVRRGYTEEQIGKIWSGNLLRVWSEVEQVAKKIQSGEIK